MEFIWPSSSLQNVYFLPYLLFIRYTEYVSKQVWKQDYL